MGNTITTSAAGNPAEGNIVMKSDDEVIILDETTSGLYGPDFSKKETMADGANPKNATTDKETVVDKTVKDNLIDINDEPSNTGNNDGGGKGNGQEGAADETLKPFAEALYNAGVFPNFSMEEFDGTLDGIFEGIANEITHGIKSYKDELPRVIKDMIDNYEEDVPLDKLIKVRSRQMEFDKITDELLRDDVDKQKRILTELYTIRGFKEDKIAKIVGKFEDIGDLQGEATEALEELKTIYKKEEDNIKIQAVERKKEQEENAKKALASIKDTITKTEEVIPGIKINKQVKDKIYESMVNVVETTQDGRPLNRLMQTRLKDPVRFDMTLHYLGTLGIFDGKWDTFRGIMKNGISKDIEAELGRRSTSGSPVNTGRDDSVTSKEVLAGLKSYLSTRQ